MALRNALARLARLAADRGEPQEDGEDDAETYLRKALAAAQRRGSARERAITRLLQGELALGAGRRAEARAHLEEARAELQRMQMPGYLAEAERWLAAL